MRIHDVMNIFAILGVFAAISGVLCASESKVAEHVPYDIVHFETERVPGGIGPPIRRIRFRSLPSHVPLDNIWLCAGTPSPQELQETAKTEEWKKHNSTCMKIREKVKHLPDGYSVVVFPKYGFQYSVHGPMTMMFYDSSDSRIRHWFAFECGPSLIHTPWHSTDDVKRALESATDDILPPVINQLIPTIVEFAAIPIVTAKFKRNGTLGISGIPDYKSIRSIKLTTETIPKNASRSELIDWAHHTGGPEKFKSLSPERNIQFDDEIVGELPSNFDFAIGRNSPLTAIFFSPVFMASREIPLHFARVVIVNDPSVIDPQIRRALDRTYKQERRQHDSGPDRKVDGSINGSLSDDEGDENGLDSNQPNVGLNSTQLVSQSDIIDNEHGQSDADNRNSQIQVGSEVDANVQGHSSDFSGAVSNSHAQSLDNQSNDALNDAQLISHTDDASQSNSMDNGNVTNIIENVELASIDNDDNVQGQSSDFSGTVSNSNVQGPENQPEDGISDEPINQSNSMNNENVINNTGKVELAPLDNDHNVHGHDVSDAGNNSPVHSLDNQPDDTLNSDEPTISQTYHVNKSDGANNNHVQAVGQSNDTHNNLIPDRTLNDNQSGDMGMGNLILYSQDNYDETAIDTKTNTGSNVDIDTNVKPAVGSKTSGALATIIVLLFILISVLVLVDCFIVEPKSREIPTKSGRSRMNIL
eukprot:773421_1